MGKILKILLVILCTSAACPEVFGVTGDTIPQRNAMSAVGDFMSPVKGFQAFVYDNPAFKNMQYAVTYSEFSLGGSIRDEDTAYLPQYGDKEKYFGIEAMSYKRLRADDVVWGAVSYRNGKKENVRWNTTSDYLTIYPYVTADAVEGNRNLEEYFFEGGYNRPIGKVTLGIEAGFRALHEYALKDPRPRNISSDLDYKIGVSSDLFAGYSVGIAYRGRMYKQTSDINFYNDRQDKTEEFCLTGLGSHYARFKGAESIYYKGFATGVSLDMTPLGERGLFVSVLYDRFSMQRFLTGSSATEIPSNKLIHHTAQIEAAYIGGGRMVWGIKGTFRHDYREGIDNLFGTSALRDYPIIARHTMYENRISEASLSAVIGSKTGKVAWYAEPSGGYCTYKEEYIYPNQLMEFSAWNAGVKLTGIRQWQKVRLQGMVKGAYFGNLTSELSIPRANMAATLIEMTETVFSRFTEDHIAGKADVRVDYGLNRKTGLFLRAGYECRISGDDSSYSGIISLNIGLTF